MSNTKTTVDTSEPDKLSVGEKIGYGLGDTASNFYWKLFENFQLIFYTDVFGISASAAATMFFVTKLWDAVNDPMMGFIADRTNSAWGRFRPYLIWMAVPFAVTGILTFYTPDFSPQGKLIYAYVTYILVFMAYTAINIPYGALLGVISSNSLERTSVSTYRFVCAFLGGLVVQKFTEPLVGYFGGMKDLVVDGAVVVVDGVVKQVVDDKQAGFFWTVVCYAIAAAILFVISFWTTRERVVPVQAENTRFRLDIWDLLKNRAWIVLVFVGLFQILADWTRGSAVGFYFKYHVGSEFGNFMVAGAIAGILGMFMTKPLTKIFGKPLLLILMNLAKAILTAAFFLLDRDQIFWMYTLHIVASFVTGPVPILLWAMYADVADYSEWKNHRRATGLVFSSATLSQKLGGALGSAVPGWTLAYYGFVAPIGEVDQLQSTATIHGIVLMMSLVPALFLCGAVVALLFYNINEPLLNTIENDLKYRKSISSST